MHTRATTTLLFLLTFGYATVVAQVPMRLQVLDGLDGRPVPEVDVTLPHGGVVRTDRSGIAQWNGGELPLTLHLTHVAFTDTVITMHGAESTVRWMPHFRGLEGVVVRGLPEEVYRSPRYHVADVLVNDHGIWLLTYERMRLVKAMDEHWMDLFLGGRLVLLDHELQEVASIPVPGESRGLRRDQRGQVLVECRTTAYYVPMRKETDGSITLSLGTLSLKELNTSVLPWTDSVAAGVLGTRPSTMVPEVEHIVRGDPGGIRTFCTVRDTFMMSLFRAEYKYMNNRDKVDAMNLAADLGLDKETVAGYMRGFGSNIWYRPTYSPLFVQADTVLVFDHASGRLLRFNGELQPVGSVPLGYRMEGSNTTRVRSLVQDRHSGQVYTVGMYNARTFLCRVDPNTGKVGPQQVLAYPFVERVYLHDGMVYYIYREPGTIQKRTMYRERLR